MAILMYVNGDDEALLEAYPGFFTNSWNTRHWPVAWNMLKPRTETLHLLLWSSFWRGHPKGSPSRGSPRRHGHEITIPICQHGSACWRLSGTSGTSGHRKPQKDHPVVGWK
jgi:hypothetical protein